MYLPATGFQKFVEKDKDKLKVDPIANINVMFKPAEAGAAQKLDQDNDVVKIEKNDLQTKEIPDEERKSFCENPKGIHSMSTQDFMVLRAGAQEESFKVLDEVIARMKENMDEVGDALEAIAKMTKETSKENVALQLLQKTFEAMDENKGE